MTFVSLYFSQSSSSSSLNTFKVSDVEIGEVDDLDQDLVGLNLGPKIASTKLLKTHHNYKSIDVQTAVVSILLDLAVEQIRMVFRDK